MQTPYDYAGPVLFGYETDALRRVAAISVHTSPLADLGGKDAGGMNVYVRELSCHLAQRGLPIDIFTRRTSPDTPEIQTICDGVDLISIDAGPPAPVGKNELYPLMDEFARQVVVHTLRRGCRYDVIHAHYWLSGWAAHLLKQYWRVPFALMFHTTAYMKNRVSPVTEHETRLRARKEQQLIGLADSIIAANPDERADLIWRQRADPARICTIPPGVDTALFQPLDRRWARRELGLPMDRPVVLFVGRIDPIKGIETLLASFRLLRERHPQALLVLVGGDLDGAGQPVGPLATVVEHARQLGVAADMRFVGSQPQNRLPLYYAAADVVSVPSRYESFGLVAVEAMACARPVVASRAGGLIFTVADDVSGFLAPIGDAEAHADRIGRILDDPSLARALGANARNEALRFSWDRVAGSVMHVYERLAGGHRSELCCGEEIYA